MNQRKICIVTGTRAEYGLFYPILKKIKSSKMLKLQIVATTMHMSEEFGLTYKHIEDDGFVIDEKVENLLASSTKSSIAKSTGLATVLLSDCFTRLQPDIVLILGDRFETHAAATAAMLMNIPLAHIHGGEITEGAVDEQIRHSITKMAQIHFTSTEDYRRRVIQMGEDPSFVFCTGAPGIDNIVSMKLLTKKELEDSLDWSLNSPTALFTYHSETYSFVDTQINISIILEQIERSGISVLFTYANADDGGSVINTMVESFCHKNNQKYKVVKSLGQLKYLSAMKHVNMMIGNTSSGIIEAATFGLPVINIGERQKGRLRNMNVIDCRVDQVFEMIEMLEAKNFLATKNAKGVNIYGEGDASSKIVKYLETLIYPTIKRFNDL